MPLGQPEPPPARLTETAKLLPVAFVVLIIGAVYAIYVVWHCVRLLQLDKQPVMRDQDMFQRGVWQTLTFFGLSSMLILCYVRSVLTDPGSIPDGPEWRFREGQELDAPKTTETKRTGERRHCKWCRKYKPDRCHHCRVCMICVLKMDHHCPWIYNCVGHDNHKFFFLLLLYTFLTTQLIVWTMFESMKKALDNDVEFFDMFVLLFGETLCGFLSVLTTGFFGFHIWLMFKAMSTIEWCEQSLKKKGFHSSPYERGTYGNVQDVLGVNPLLWLLPIADYSNNGLSFHTLAAETVPLSYDLERKPLAAEVVQEEDEFALAPPPTTATQLLP